MRIRGWHIEGFGVFSDHRIADIPDGLTVFLGPNEAGKSTLLAFLRGALFGYPSGRSRESQYPPLRGGRHGGKIVIDVDGQGLVTVCRYVERRTPMQITLADGTVVTEPEFSRMLGGADRGLFQQIFAFSLSDLQQLETLETQGVRDRIFSAGIAGAGRSAGDVVRKLEEEIKGLYAPRSRTAKAAELLRRLEDLASRLREAKGKAEEYSQLCRLEDECLGQVRSLAQRQDDLSGRAQRYKTLEELWPTWDQMQADRDTLSRLDAVDSFPPDPDRRLTQAKSDCLTAESRLTELSAARQATADRCEELRRQLDDRLSSIATEVMEHHADLRLHREHLANLSASQQTVTQSETSVQDALRALGPGWDCQRVQSFDTSLPRSEHVRQWRERLASVANASAQAAAATATLEKQVADAVRECQRIQTKLDSSGGPDESSLRERESAAEQVGSIQSRLQVLQAQAAGQAAVIEERERPLASVPTEQVSRRAAILLVVIAIMAGGAAVWRIIVGDAFAFVTSLCLAALAGLAAWLWGRKKPRSAVPSGLAEALAKAKEDHAKALGMIQDQGVELARCARALGLGDSPTPEQISQACKKVREDRRTADDRRGVQDRLREAEERLKELQGDLEGARKSSSIAEESRTKAEQAWQAWKSDSGVPAELTPDGVLAFLPRVEAARERIRARDEARAAEEQLDGRIAAWQRRGRDLLSRAGRAVPEATGEGAIIDAFLALHRACGEDSERRQNVQVLEDEIRGADTAIGTATGASERARRVLQALLAEAGVQDEPAFLARLEIFQQRQQLNRGITNWERTMTERLGLGPDADAVRTELATGQVSQWQQAKSEAERGLTQARADHEAAVRRHQDATNARRAVEDSADVPSLEMQIEAARCELANVLDSWRVKSIAKAIVQTTLRQFVHDRQPAVLAEASRRFQQVTAGRYVQIEQDPDGNSLGIVDRDQGRKHPEQLSRGTAEQLYMCLRLALAQEFGRQRCPLPVVMDDVLVNFDPSRAQAMAQALADFAQSNQILLFTCHPATVDVLRGVCPQLRFADLAVTA